MGHFLTLQVPPTLKNVDLKMALSAPKLFIWSANISNYQMQWYIKLLDLILVIQLAIFQKHKYRVIRCLYIFLEYGTFPDTSGSSNP